MKVLIIATTDIKGGAARAAFRVHRGLITAGVESYMLVREKYSNDNTVISIDGFWNKYFARYAAGLDFAFTRFYPKKRNLPFSSNLLPTRRIIRLIAQIKPDVVNVQFASNGLIRLEHWSDIGCPIVLTLQDMWPFTGGCHYDGNCGRFRIGCGSCPQLQSRNEKDLSNINWLRKKHAWKKLEKISVVGTSEWITRLAMQSPLLNSFKFQTIPNALDLAEFDMKEVLESRSFLNLPHRKKLILFGAISATTDDRKGYSLLVEALSQVTNSGFELVIFGSDGSEISDLQGYRTHFLGHINDNSVLAKVYSACDVTVVPSLQEAFGQTVTESLACGTAVVAFDTNGPKDIVEHKKCGYLATPFSTVDLANGIDWILSHQSTIMSKNCRLRVEQYYSIDKVTETYINLFENMLN